VQPERDRAKIVIDRLNGEFQGVARIEVLRWEDAFYTAAHSFQEAIDQVVARMSGTDIVGCIVWSRVGLKLNPAVWRRQNETPYESGTVLEFETACEASRQHDGAPDVYLFRKTAEVLYHANRFAEEKEQHELLDAVWKRWTQTEEGCNTAGYQRFSDTDEFEQQFESCMRQWLSRRGVAVGGVIWERDLKGSPFCGLAPFESSHAMVFFGREAAIEKAITKLRRSRFLLLIGASGSGKSSLLRAGLLPRITRPGIVPDVDTWRAVIVLPAADPLLSLAEALCSDDAIGKELREGNVGSPDVFIHLLEAGWETAEAPIRGALDRIAKRRAAEFQYDIPRPVCLLIAVDQVERLFVEADASRDRGLRQAAPRSRRSEARLRDYGVAQRRLRTVPEDRGVRSIAGSRSDSGSAASSRPGTRGHRDATGGGVPAANGLRDRCRRAIAGRGAGSRRTRRRRFAAPADDTAAPL
jgi:hypothetical protein